MVNGDIINIQEAQVAVARAAAQRVAGFEPPPRLGGVPCFGEYEFVKSPSQYACSHCGRSLSLAYLGINDGNIVKALAQAIGHWRPA